MDRMGRPVISWSVWKRSRVWAIELGKDTSQLAELGLRLVLALLDLGYVPPELIAALEVADKELGEELAKLVELAKHKQEKHAIARG